MKNSRLVFLFMVLLAVRVFTGCEIVTQEPPTPIVKPANNVVINELFILPAPNQNPFRWIEFYNPTNTSVNLGKWTLGYRTRRTVVAVDTNGITTGFSGDVTPVYHDVPLRFLRKIPLGANGFITIASNVDLMENYWTPVALPDPVDQGETVVMPTDTISVDSMVTTIYEFNFLESDQIVLKDSTGQTVDVVRYGNYIFPGPGSDPYPQNQSLGPIVPYQSYSRFAGAYTSGPGGNAALGNSAADFYVTGVQVLQTIPIPQWLSQAYKQ